MNPLEKLFDGAYTYHEKGVPYSQENFWVYKNIEKNFLLYKAEILTRVTTGEFLKINCSYEVNTFWAPQKVTIHKTLGPNFATETFTPDYENQQLHYEFTNNQGTQKISRNIVTRYQIATPAICSSMVLSLTKKFDSMSRNACILVTSNNSWDYTEAISDRSVFIEYKTHENTELQINGKTLSCTKCLMFQTDSLSAQQIEVPAVFYISKHVGLPYLVENGDITIQVKNLNKSKTASFDDFT